MIGFECSNQIWLVEPNNIDFPEASERLAFCIILPDLARILAIESMWPIMVTNSPTWAFCGRGDQASVQIAEGEVIEKVKKKC